MRVETLTRERAQELAEQLSEADILCHSEMGMIFALDAWRSENFLLELPGKWSLSQVAFSDAGALAGVWVASIKGDACHTHRVVVSKSARGQGIGRAMYARVYERAREMGLRKMTLRVNRRNTGALAFYRKMGFDYG